ncbi:hypothetical protein [Amycolatopsis sp. TNS106]|uniref:hypothetical protein n=1 Tax=Amycolatopsis sp. TNS106 TaxID=2861750 RepID=UPI001C57410E|nr:hypothetical protein [Amycolatopsis sp. TNS106]
MRRRRPGAQLASTISHGATQQRICQQPRHGVLQVRRGDGRGEQRWCGCLLGEAPRIVGLLAPTEDARGTQHGRVPRLVAGPPGPLIAPDFPWKLHACVSSETAAPASIPTTPPLAGRESVAALAKNLAIIDSCLRTWMAQVEADEAGSTTWLTSAEKENLPSCAARIGRVSW